MIHEIKGFHNKDNLDVYLDGELLDPKPSQKVWNHSPDGFNAGYCGSGPAQLALEILLKVTDKRTAIDLHQDFKFEWLPSLNIKHKISCSTSTLNDGYTINC